MKIDLHVHSKHSIQPSQWILQKLGCPESFTEPEALYRTAKRKGMDLVTITDHNTISGALEIARFPG
ncbi:MAG: PHP domain-containing protein, partial [Syntrophobacteraceae bacterium]